VSLGILNNDSKLFTQFREKHCFFVFNKKQECSMIKNHFITDTFAKTKLAKGEQKRRVNMLQFFFKKQKHIFHPVPSFKNSFLRK